MAHRDCGGHSKITRRSLLFQSAALSNFLLLRSHADAAVTQLPVRPRNTAKRCVFINLAGAPSHLDTFAPKEGPWSPPNFDLREYGNGVRLSNLLFPNVSKLASDLCVLRSVSSWEAAHERGQFYLMTSHSFNPSSAPELPHIGAVCGFERGVVGPTPPFVAVNAGQIQGSAILGGRFSPFTPPAQRTGLTTLQHCCFGNHQARFDQRARLLDALEAPLVRAPLSEESANLANYRDAARSIMYKDAVAASFRFTADEEARYGNSALGRSLLVIRNLVRADNGAVFLTTTHGGWDTHFGMYDRGIAANLYNLTGTLDRALAEFVTDLKQSNNLADTLVVVMGEFGRTPGDLNARGGRDHWKEAMCALLIGGGVRGGLAIGDTDPTGAEITTPGWSKDRPIYMEDIACTIYSALGINWTKTTTDTPTGKKYEYVPGAEYERFTSVDEVFA